MIRFSNIRSCGAFESNRILFEFELKIEFRTKCDYTLQITNIHVMPFHLKYQSVTSVTAVTCMASKFSICDKLMLSCIRMNGKMHLGTDCDTETKREKLYIPLFSCSCFMLYKICRERERKRMIHGRIWIQQRFQTDGNIIDCKLHEMCICWIQ